MKQFVRSFIFLLLLVGVIVTQLFYDKQKSRAAYSEPLVLGSEIIKAVDLGLHNAAADFFWLSAIQYFGGGESATYEKLDDYLFLSTDLDPKFSHPYAFGTLILPGINQTDQAIKLANKGIERAKPDWEIPYYLAMIYHLNSEDKAKALKYFNLAAETVGAPENIRVVAANYGTHPDLRAETKQIWIATFEGTNDEVIKEQAKKYIVHLEILDLLENAAKQYFEKNEKYPEKIEDLISAKILSAIPIDPFGFEYKIDSEGRARIKN